MREIGEGALGLISGGEEERKMPSVVVTPAVQGMSYSDFALSGQTLDGAYGSYFNVGFDWQPDDSCGAHTGVDSLQSLTADLDKANTLIEYYSNPSPGSIGDLGDAAQNWHAGVSAGIQLAIWQERAAELEAEISSILAAYEACVSGAGGV